VSAPALVVPGDGLFGRDGSYRISRACRRLVGEAERLARRVDARLVVFTGWAPDDGPSEAEQMRRLWRGPPIDLVTGFLSPDGEAWGRPVGVAIDRRGDLLIADDVGNTIWRVSAA